MLQGQAEKLGRMNISTNQIVHHGVKAVILACTRCCQHGRLTLAFHWHLVVVETPVANAKVNLPRAFQRRRLCRAGVDTLPCWS